MYDHRVVLKSDKRASTEQQMPISDHNLHVEIDNLLMTPYVRCTFYLILYEKIDQNSKVL